MRSVSLAEKWSADTSIGPPFADSCASAPQLRAFIIGPDLPSPRPRALATALLDARAHVPRELHARAVIVNGIGRSAHGSKGVLPRHGRIPRHIAGFRVELRLAGLEVGLGAGIDQMHIAGQMHGLRNLIVGSHVAVDREGLVRAGGQFEHWAEQLDDFLARYALTHRLGPADGEGAAAVVLAVEARVLDPDSRSPRVERRQADNKRLARR